MVLITSCGNTPVEKPNPFIDPVVTLQCVGDGSLSFNFHTNKEYKRNDLLYGGKVITLTAPSMKVKTYNFKHTYQIGEKFNAKMVMENLHNYPYKLNANNTLDLVRSISYSSIDKLVGYEVELPIDIKPSDIMKEASLCMEEEVINNYSPILNENQRKHIDNYNLKLYKGSFNDLIHYLTNVDYYSNDIYNGWYYPYRFYTEYRVTKILANKRVLYKGNGNSVIIEYEDNPSINMNDGIDVGLYVVLPNTRVELDEDNYKIKNVPTLKFIK